MSLREKEENRTSPVERKLIFAITEHEALGMLIEGFVVEITRFRQFSLSSRRVSSFTAKDYIGTLTEGERQILSIIDQYSDEEILKRFGKRFNKPSEFYNSMPEEVFQEHIRPYIDRRIARVLQIMAGWNMVVYRKGKRREPVNEHPLKINPVPAEVIFHFSKTDDGIEYRLAVTSGGKEIPITGKPWRIISTKPCWIVCDDSVMTVDERVDGNKLLPFFTKDFIHISAAAESKYFETFVLNAVRNFKVIAKGFTIDDITDFQQVFLTLEQLPDGFPGLALSFGYASAEVFCGETAHTMVRLLKDEHGYHYLRVIRNQAKEDEVAGWLKAKGLTKHLGGYFRVEASVLAEESFQVSELIEWINLNTAELNEKGIIIRQKGNYQYFTGTIRISQSMLIKSDWFDLKIMVHFGDISIPFIKLRQNILSGNREFLLPDGTIAVLPKEWFSKYRDLVQLGNPGTDSFRVRKCHLHLLDESITGEKIPVAERMKEGLKSLSLNEVRIPKGIEAQLRPYQLAGFQWLNVLQELGLGGCLADDMGLGKTLQALAILADSKGKKSVLHIEKTGGPGQQLDLFGSQNNAGEVEAITSLIVMPLSLIWNWENEIRKFAPRLNVYKHIGVGRITSPDDFYRYDIILTTYGIVRNDLELLKKCEFRYIILDESQAIKNPFSKIFRAVRQLHSRYKLVLTGTPIENSLTDLWAQMTFLNEGILGNLAYFRNEFLVPIEKNRDPEKEEKLKKIIAPFILRRTKEMVAQDLPSLTEQVYYCEMDDDQRQIYETRKSEIRNVLIESITKSGIEKSRFIILKGLMELRLLANHPVLLPWSPESSSGKFEEVMRSVENIIAEGHKVLVFSSFVRHLNVFARAFEKEGWKYVMLTGQTHSADRMTIVKKFQEDGETPIFLMTMKAGGVGINLTAADYVFILDPWWNPAVENQAIARAHRIGQEKKVMAYKFITRDTIEEKILNLQQHKSDLAELFVRRNDPLQFITKETIVKLTE
ncbi:MAG: DEAD/DEAH box helicase [Bacteroidales bacterium]|nr:DEAD/DEAH box helicase [Bacteroidales bacterium]